MMKRKMISAVLAAVMTVGMITGCGSSQTTTENKADKADKLESQTDLSSTDYDFEKEYAYGDFNAHSRADEDRQDGIDTFEDKDIVFQDITYDKLGFPCFAVCPSYLYQDAHIDYLFHN